MDLPLIEPTLPKGVEEDTKHSTASRSIKYKMRVMNMSPNGMLDTSYEPKPANTYDTIQKFLDAEKINNKFDTWNKLTKSLKHKKIQEYVGKYSESNGLMVDEKELLLTFLINKINTGQLSNSKEVSYNKTDGVIKEIPGISFNRHTKHITLKNIDNRHVTTVKNLKALLKSIEDI